MDGHEGGPAGPEKAPAGGPARTDTERKRWPPHELLDRIMHDPSHMAERSAEYAIERSGEEATAALAKMRAKGGSTDEVLEGVVTRAVRTTIAEGAFVGGPFLALVPAAFCAAMLAQLRMVLEIAELSGQPATSPALAADLLVVQGVYPDLPQARRAITDLPPRGAPRPSLSLREWLSVVRRMAYVLGVVSPSTPGETTRLVRGLRVAGVVLLVAVGVVLPFIWVPVLGLAYRSGTTRLGERAAEHFGLVRAEPDPARSRGRLRPLALLVFLRTVFAVLLPLGVAVLMVATGTKVAGHKWLAAAIGVVLVSLVSCFVWRFRQWRSRR
ncbi:hypothetical protein [Kitasatospora sp. NPDC059571]|uniref:hypothetical protein n=1 Tax=Kitasatospora sp. NPDC059571 TaxID=3346871 RepID=UPI003685216E